MARKYIKQYSYREVANWLMTKTNRDNISRRVKKKVDA
jgi:hypothetical protein